MIKQLTNIMLVEDEPDIREIAQLALAELGGFKVTTCYSGQNAVDLLPQVKPQLIMLDVMMPGMNGMETMGKLRQMPDGENVPVIFMTARVQAENIQTYKDLGAIGTLAKPFDPSALSAQITRLWNEYVQQC